MIRVLHIVKSMDMGGLETFIMNIYRKIDRDKVQFDFLMHTDKECVFSKEIRSLGGNLFNVPERNRGVLNNKKALNSFFKEHPEYSIVHQHLNSLSYIEPLKAAKRNNVRVRIIHGHSTKEGGSKIHNLLHCWNKLFIKRYITDYFACSDLSAKWLFSKKIYRSGAYQIINNGIDTDLFGFKYEVRNRMRKELNIVDKFVVGLVGRFSYPKNHEFLIDIFESIHKKNNSSVLLLVGDGEMRSSIEYKLKEKGLE
ncbi:MAG: glycosyltransferase, partial [Eubacteriales bacterium]